MKFSEWKKNGDEYDRREREMRAALEPARQAALDMHAATFRDYLLPGAVVVSLASDRFHVREGGVALAELAAPTLRALAEVRETWERWKAGELDDMPPSGKWKPKARPLGTVPARTARQGRRPRLVGVPRRP